MHRFLLVMGFVAVGLSGLSAACDATNIADTVYTCSDCKKSCDNPSLGSCEFNCTGGKCDFSCPGGSCAVNCKAGQECKLACPDGSCSMLCGPDSTKCEITECTDSCRLTCGGAADCKNSCGLEDGCTGG